MQKIISFDTETFYDADITIKEMGIHKYSWDPRAACYLISVCDGITTWAGPPKDFDFSLLDGAVVVSHNKAFDAEVFRAHVARGEWPDVKPAEWHCTANMSAYLCNRRSLADSAEFLLGKGVSKGMRDWMKGKTWEDAVAAGKAEELLQYARDDAQLCWELWEKHGHRWPAWERRLSNLTIEQGRRGVYIHQERLQAGILLLQRVILAATDMLPWVKTGRAPASPHGVAEACRLAGINPPPVKAHNPDAAAEWEEQHSGRFPWIKALKDLRKAKKTLATLETMKLRTRDDGVMCFSLKYFGAHTGRWSGDAGINFQNFNREPIFVRPDNSLEDDRKVITALMDVFEVTPDDPRLNCIDVRGLLLPPPGMLIGAPDLSQIEPRVLNYVAGNRDLLQKIRDGFPIYEAHARDSMGWTGGKLKNENKKIYSLAKARVLGLGFGCGWEKFITVARTMAQLDITEDDERVALLRSADGVIYREHEGKPCHPYILVRHTSVVTSATMEGVSQETVDELCPEAIYGANSRAIVKDFRDHNPKIVALWTKLQDAFEAAEGDDFEIELPSGRKLTYRKVRREIRTVKDKATGLPKKKTVFTAEADGVRRIFYGGLLVENLVQAIARDVFAENMLRILDAGVWPMWSVHDEAVCAVRDADENERARRQMAATPDWLPGCPVESEATLSDRYKK